jgi:thymidylate synthase
MEGKMYLLHQYDDALREILEAGVERTNQRTGIKTLSVFGMMCRYRLSGSSFPILTKRKVWPASVFKELLWFLSGSTNNHDLERLGCNFWTPWVDSDFEKKHGFAPGSFGPVYGFQLRHFGGYYGNGIGGYAESFEPSINIEAMRDGQLITEWGSAYGMGGFDQLAWIVNRIKEDSSCRRTLWTLWNPQDVPKMRLPPCHMLFQVLVDDERRLTGILYQRSADFPIGVPANIQFYSALVVMLAQQTNCTPHDFVHVTADSHIYEDQIPAVKEYLSRSETPPSPLVTIAKADDIFSYSPSSFIVNEYNPLPRIEIPVAV